MAVLQYSSARLGLELGYEAVEEVFSFRYRKKVPNLPSVFIGSFELSPYQAIQAYQTIADDGFYTPLRSIRQIRKPLVRLSSPSLQC